MSKRGQFDLFAAPEPMPEGLRCAIDLIDAEEERALVARMAELPFAPFEFQDFLGKRRTVSFGWNYKFDGSGLADAEAIPGWLQPLREKAAAFAGVAAEALEHVLVIEYDVGAALGWHRDRPEFGDVIGVSLLSQAPLRFRRKVGGGKWERFSLPAPPRSVYLLRGPARTEWEHSLTPVEALRYSVTFRTLRR